MLAELTYDDATGLPNGVRPLAIGAFNDCCSIRRPGAKKISHKKNWGAESKGVAPAFLSIDGDLTGTGPTSTWRLAASCAAPERRTRTASTAACPTTPTTATPCSTGSPTASASRPAARHAARERRRLPARRRTPAARAHRHRRHPLHPGGRVDVPPARRRIDRDRLRRRHPESRRGAARRRDLPRGRAPVGLRAAPARRTRLTLTGRRRPMSGMDPYP